jgi:hypothetical protein
MEIKCTHTVQRYESIWRDEECRHVNTPHQNVGSETLSLMEHGCVVGVQHTKAFLTPVFTHFRHSVKSEISS